MTPTNLEAQQLILSFNNLEGIFFFWSKKEKKKKICGGSLMDVNVLKQFYEKFM